MTTLRVSSTARRGSWIPWIFVGGMLLVVAVNAVMIRLAVGTFSGVTVERPYERGIAYNTILAAQARQDRLGWTAEVRLQTTGGGSILHLALRDADGQPLEASPTLRLERPLEPESRIETIPDGDGSGRWIARLERLRPGQWDVTVDARRADGRLHLRRRVMAE
ncbi:FixH family protein [Stella sp.]|uniref:FixH family protein n=1 Tax=Stella sp. TaxID=2912054 RepID=UPI0035B108A1